MPIQYYLCFEIHLFLCISVKEWMKLLAIREYARLNQGHVCKEQCVTPISQFYGLYLLIKLAGKLLKGLLKFLGRLFLTP